MDDKKELVTLPEGTQIVVNAPPIYLDGKLLQECLMPYIVDATLKALIRQEVALQTKDILAALEKQIRLQTGVK